jgi:hypothetical protein
VKTISLKKVSAVAVASLGFGLLSVIPANAAGTSQITPTGGVTLSAESAAATATGVVGNQVIFTFNSGDDIDYIVTSDAGGSIISASPSGTSTATKINGTSFADGLTFTSSDTDEVLTVATTSAKTGSQVVTVRTLAAGTGLYTSVAKITITWVASSALDLASVVVKTVADANAGDCTVAGIADVATVSYDTSAGSAATICVVALNGSGTAKTGATVTILSKAPATFAGAGVASSVADADGLFNAAITGNGVGGTGTFDVSVSATNQDGTTKTVTGTASMSFGKSTAASVVLTQTVVALDDDAAKTAVISFAVKDSNGVLIAKADDNGTSLVVDSDVSSSTTIDEAGEEDATATVVIESASSVASTGTGTSGTISLTCTDGVYEKITVKMHLESNTVASNTLTIYCTEKLADVTTETLSVTAIDAAAGAKQTLAGTVLAGITTKPTYPVADEAAATGVSFASSGGSFVPAATAAIVGGAATVDFYASAISGNYTINATAGGATAVKTIKVTGGGLDGITTMVDALNAKIVALNALIAKIMKKLGVK